MSTVENFDMTYEYTEAVVSAVKRVGAGFRTNILEHGYPCKEMSKILLSHHLLCIGSTMPLISQQHIRV